MLFTTGQAARILGVNRYTIRDWARSGKVPSIRWGRRYMLETESLELLQRILEGREYAQAKAEGKV
ncbi:helix-turn-helix domain-containing protein [Meiothermus sp. Pnk-1]